MITRMNHRTFASLSVVFLCGVGCGDPAADEATVDTTTNPTATNTTTTTAVPTGVPTATGTTPAPTTVPPGGVAPSACLAETAADGSLLLKANPINNYAFTSHLQPTDVVVKNQAEFFVDWSGMTKDFLGHDIGPTNPIDMILLVEWKVPKEEVIRLLNEDALGPDSTQIAAAYYPTAGETRAGLFQFQIPGGALLTPEEILPEVDVNLRPADQFSFSIMPSTGLSPGDGIKMFTTLTLDPASTNTEVVIDSNSAALTYTATLSTLQPVSVPVSNPTLTVDWSQMIADKALNALGKEFTDRHISDVIVGHYALTPSELEGRFLDLEEPSLAQGLWKGEVTAGKSLGLSTLVDSAGNAFPGIDGTGTWIVALQCNDKCGNPAPWYLTQLVPCGQ